MEKSMARYHTDQLLTELVEARRKKEKRHALLKTPPRSPPYQPPPLPPLAGSSGTPGASGASGFSSKIVASAEYTAWTTTDIRLKPSVLSIPEELHMDDDTTHDEQASALASTYAPPLENSLLAQTGDMAIFIDWFCKKQGITELKQQDLEGPMYEIVKVFHPNMIHLQYQMEECHKLLTDQVDESIIKYNDLEYLRYGHKSGRPGLSISKMKASYYPDVGLEQMVPDQMWIEEECKYDYMKKIVFRRADLKEYTIAKRDFKYMYPSDFEDLYLLNLQGHLDHLPPEDKKILTAAVNLWTRNLVIRQHVEDFQLGIESYQMQLNLTKPRWDATGFEFKHDFIVIDYPRAFTFRDKYGVQMIMRFNKIHKFSDGTLQQIDDTLDYRVKEFKVNRMNLGLNTQFWTRKDVDRSKEF
ncbi:hypothetical protein Tco_1280406, partial [Tanacetum coccineum]